MDQVSMMTKVGKKVPEKKTFFSRAQPLRGRGRGQGSSPASFLFLNTILFHSSLHGDSLVAQEEAVYLFTCLLKWITIKASRRVPSIAFCTLPVD
tara:strand:+ start:46 stop:330 length:285 start_codon:yes stop_codon:yes gene_type:complete